MELAEAQYILRQVNGAVATGSWDPPLTTAVQRALAEFYLLNPGDDVDGRIGRRTRGAWQLFKEATTQGSPDTIEGSSARLLLQAVDNPAGFIGQAQVTLQPDLEFRRGHGPANQATSVPALIEAAQAQHYTRAQIAYLLATAEHETQSFNTLEEYDDGTQYEGRVDLENLQPNDGPRFKGRGYVQLTGRRNYRLYTELTGFELVKLPIILMNWPALSAFVIVDGMMRGVYTGQRLDEFVNGSRQDFYHARQVVNGLDRARQIADLAYEWMRRLN
ncbi:MAG TPA: hypothetical protein VGX03_04480 [Candidatus Binatia bacterium]|jgi:hypothetical protein|nr:hypothetical protein [Candidatus Binatia bacterium]